MQLAGAALYNSYMENHPEDGEEEAFDIEEEAELFDILAVKLSFFDDLERVSAVDLRPAGEPGLDVVSAVLVALGYKIILIPQSGTRPDDTHLADEYIPDLRQLVQTELSEKAADASDILIGVLEQMSRYVMRRRHLHSAELMHVKMLFMQTDALLSKECGTGIVDFDCDYYDQIEPRQHYQAEK